MALQINITNAHNINYTNAYAKIHEFWGNGQQIRIEVLFFEDAASYQQGDSAVERLNFTFPFVDGMNVSDLYTALKTQDLFTSAIDV